MSNQSSEMTAEVVIELVHLFKQHHILVHIDGGWGVDALLGESDEYVNPEN